MSTLTGSENGVSSLERDQVLRIYDLWAETRQLVQPTVNDDPRWTALVQQAAHAMAVGRSVDFDAQIANLQATRATEKAALDTRRLNLARTAWEVLDRILASWGDLRHIFSDTLGAHIPGEGHPLPAAATGGTMPPPPIPPIDPSSTAEGAAMDADVDVDTVMTTTAPAAPAATSMMPPPAPPRHPANGVGRARRRRQGATQQRTTTPPRPPRRDTIEFDEVFGGGNAAKKAIIIEQPHVNHERGQAGSFWILECLDHGTYFASRHGRRGTLTSARRHLVHHRSDHRPSRSLQTLNMLGVQVLNCNREKARANNESVIAAIVSRRYKPLNRTSRSHPDAGRGARRRREEVEAAVAAAAAVTAMEAATDSTAPAPAMPPIFIISDGETADDEGGPSSTIRVKSATPTPASAILPPAERTTFRSMPQVGGLFTVVLARLGGRTEVLAGVRLPMGPFTQVGLRGGLEESIEAGRLGPVPDCWSRTPTTGEYRWSTNWEDGMNDKERQYPFLLLDGDGTRDAEMEDCSLQWVKAHELRKFNRHHVEQRHRPLVTAYKSRRRAVRLASNQAGEGGGDPPSGSTNTEYTRHRRADDGTGTVASSGPRETDASSRVTANAGHQTTNAASANSSLGISLEQAIHDFGTDLPPMDTSWRGSLVRSDILPYPLAATVAGDDHDAPGEWDANLMETMMRTSTATPSEPPQIHQDQQVEEEANPQQPIAEMAPTPPPPPTASCSSSRAAAQAATRKIRQQTETEQQDSDGLSSSGTAPPRLDRHRRIPRTPSRPRPTMSAQVDASAGGVGAPSRPHGTPCRRTNTRFSNGALHPTSGNANAS